MQHKIKISKTATYHSEGDIKTAKNIWFVLHGYGMLSKYFIRKFNPILNDNTFIIAPEGLSKFYNKGFYGSVGSSWMTKENRDDEIEDYINYLDQLYKAIVEENEATDLKINVVGFSQGGATASRWLANQKSKCDNFILWSSYFPEDINLDLLTKNSTIFALIGDGDEYINDLQITEYEKSLEASKTKCKLIRFKGNHDIPIEVLLEQTKINNW